MSNETSTLSMPWDYKRGDHVTHQNMGKGCVLSSSGRGVIVRYEHERGEGLYDCEWFQTYPNLLWKNHG